MWNKTNWFGKHSIWSVRYVKQGKCAGVWEYFKEQEKNSSKLWTHRSIFVFQEGTDYFTVPQQDRPSLARVPSASFILVVTQLVWRQHEPAGLPVVHQMTLRSSGWSENRGIFRDALFFFSFTTTQTKKRFLPMCHLYNLHTHTHNRVKHISLGFLLCWIKNVLPASPRILPLEPRSSCLRPSCSSVTLSSACSYLLR